VAEFTVTVADLDRNRWPISAKSAVERIYPAGVCWNGRGIL